MSGSKKEKKPENESGSGDMDFNLDPGQIKGQDPDKFWDDVTNKSGNLQEEIGEGMYTYDQARELGILNEEELDDE